MLLEDEMLHETCENLKHEPNKMSARDAMCSARVESMTSRKSIR